MLAQWKAQFTRRFRDRRGYRHPAQVLVLFALASIPLMGFVGLSIDGGNIFVQRRLAQNAADAGALAAIRDIAMGNSSPGGTPLADATYYANQNIPAPT